jgi:hypothetical protein
MQSETTPNVNVIKQQRYCNPPRHVNSPQERGGRRRRFHLPVGHLHLLAPKKPPIVHIDPSPWEAYQSLVSSLLPWASVAEKRSTGFVLY